MLVYGYMDDLKNFWSTKDLAEASGLDPSTIRHLILDGKIEAKKFGNAWMIWDFEARRWLEDRKRSQDIE